MSDELKCGPCRRGQHGCCDGGLYVQCECCGMATGQATGDDLAEKVAAVLHHEGWPADDGWTLTPDTCETCARSLHLAAALLPLIREREAAAWERALFDAADDLEQLVDDQHPDALNPDSWLRDRAAANPYAGSEGGE